MQAVRPDLADIRLADHVFAPHYAAPVVMRLVLAATLRASAGNEAEAIAALVPGDVFEMLDVSAGLAWGIALRPGLVGYVDRAALEATGGAA